jgi:hypothetical protein
MHDATGHHFRASVLQLKVSGVGPKVCSFAWLLLQPMRSQLATIDVHMMRVLGHNYEKDMNNRDYAKFERELAAGRDAAGYGHVPLGAFQWAAWDAQRTGLGSHQDHSAMRVLDPMPHADVNWAAKAQGSHDLNVTEGPMQSAQWWRDTQEARDKAAEEFDKTTGYKVPKNQIPFQGQLPVTAKSMHKRAASMLAPYLIHPVTKEKIVGPQGMSVMQHARNQLHLSTPEIWQQIGDEAVGKA